ncbi:MAG: acyltransferase [Rhodospirillales bacterium]|nr:acyltransferase [Rhodospirillales bacterium]
MRKEITSLTSLRGFAAMAVILMHYSATMQPLASGKFPSLAPHGELAVDIFFILSGFIMAYTYLPSFRTEKGWTAAYWPFLTKRAARILPLNIAVTILLIVMAMIASWLFRINIFPKVRLTHIPTDLILNALMLPGIGIGYSINWPAWSISVEFLAYFLFPLFLAGVFHQRTTVFLMSCGAACFLIVLVCATGNHLSPDGIHGHYFLPWRDLGRCFSEFVLGLATYRAYASGRYRTIFRRDAVVFVLLAAIAAIIGLRLGDLFALFLFPLLILSLSLNDGRVKAIMAARLPHFLGIISFSLYLVHDNFRPIAAMIVHALHPAPIAPLVAMGLAAMFSVLMIFPAWACYTWIERPGRTLLRALPARIAAKRSAP